MTIYALVDPFDMTIRYVGRTISGKARLGTHMSAGSNPLSPVCNQRKTDWIVSLRERRVRAIFVELERRPLNDYARAERDWIARYRAKGDLYNALAGDNDGAYQAELGNLRRKSDTALLEAWIPAQLKKDVIATAHAADQGLTDFLISALTAALRK